MERFEEEEISCEVDVVSMEENPDRGVLRDVKLEGGVPVHGDDRPPALNHGRARDFTASDWSELPSLVDVVPVEASSSGNSEIFALNSASASASLSAAVSPLDPEVRFGDAVVDVEDVDESREVAGDGVGYPRRSSTKISAGRLNELLETFMPTPTKSDAARRSPEVFQLHNFVVTEDGTDQAACTTNNVADGVITTKMTVSSTSPVKRQFAETSRLENGELLRRRRHRDDGGGGDGRRLTTSTTTDASPQLRFSHVAASASDAVVTWRFPADSVLSPFHWLGVNNNNDEKWRRSGYLKMNEDNEDACSDDNDDDDDEVEGDVILTEELGCDDGELEVNFNQNRAVTDEDPKDLKDQIIMKRKEKDGGLHKVPIKMDLLRESEFNEINPDGIRTWDEWASDPEWLPVKIRRQLEDRWEIPNHAYMQFLTKSLGFIIICFLILFGLYIVIYSGITGGFRQSVKDTLMAMGEDLRFISKNLCKRYHKPCLDRGECSTTFFNDSWAGIKCKCHNGYFGPYCEFHRRVCEEGVQLCPIRTECVDRPGAKFFCRDSLGNHVKELTNPEKPSKGVITFSWTTTWAKIVILTVTSLVVTNR